MIEAISLVDGLRSPFCTDALRHNQGNSILAMLLEELFIRNQVEKVDEIILSTFNEDDLVNHTLEKMKINVPFSVLHSLSGLEALLLGMQKIQSGQCDSVVVAAADFASKMPLIWPREGSFLMRSREIKDWLKLRPRHLKAVDPLKEAIEKKMSRGKIASQKVNLCEEEIRAFLEKSKARALEKQKITEQNILPIPIAPKYSSHQLSDEAKGLCDGAVVLLLSRQDLFDNSLGFLLESTKIYAKDFAMLRAVHSLLEKSNQTLENFDFLDLDESSIESLVAQEKAFKSDTICKDMLGFEKAVGEIKRINPAGGTLSFGDALNANALCQILTSFAVLEEENKKSALVASESNHLGIAIQIERE